MRPRPTIGSCYFTLLGTCKQDAVEELATDPPGVIERLRPTLRDLKDLDPAIASLHHRRIQPSRLLSLLGTMRKVCSTENAGYVDVEWGKARRWWLSMIGMRDEFHSSW